MLLAQSKSLNQTQSQSTSFFRTRILPVAFGTSLLVLFAKLYIPLQPVPMSLQTVAVMFIGLLYTPRQAIEVVTLYLTLGAVGVPVFASSGTGLPYLIGSTGGFLMGFLAAVASMAWVRDKWLGKSCLVHQTLLCTLGTAIIYAFGIAWLTVLVGFQSAITVGLMPFLLPSVIKIGILVSLLQMARFFR